uniref:Fibronectin n=1 Tax=Petromyzon marinus TaxID=7757 RepID=A0AAJ7THB6_PETMA|nr:fibronectin-like [Petromyzon marinus]XP_032817976.1 fibronectin-like [Petromyzon marinus]
MKMLRLVLREQLPLFCSVLALAGMMIVAAAPPPPPGARQALLHPLRSPRLSPLHAARLGAQTSPRVVPVAQSARRQLSDEPLRHGPWPRSSTSSAAAATESLGRHDGKTVKRPLASAESRALGAVLSRVARARLRESRGKSPLREEGGGAGGAGGAGGSLSPSYRARSAQRRFTPTESRADTTEPDSSSGGCLDAGRWWAPRARWERVFQGKRLECTCLGGRRVHCRALRSEEPQAGKGGHGGGAGSSEGDACRDTALSRWFSVGQAWERPHRGWMLLDCRCISKGNIHCSSRNRCNDAATRRSYRAGERWQKRDAAGVPLLCTCGGNEQGQWTCVRKGPGADPDQTRTTLGNPKGRKQQGGGVTSDEVEEGVGTESPAASPLASSGSEAVPEAAAESGSEGSDPGRVRKVVTRDQAGGGADRRTRCRLGRGVEFVSGQRWTRAQGQHREICSCSAGGEAKCVPLGMARTRGGNADGDPCVFPFVFEGMALWGCTARGRTDGRQWCGTTSNFDRDSRYTYCVDEMEMLVPSQGGNSHGALCALPFSFGGRVYSECTAVGRDDGELWCSTTADFDGDGKYGFCPMNGQCSVDGVLHESGKSFFKRHEEGHLMNCTCHGRERGMWTCDGLDQCQDSDSRDYHQVGDTWAKVVDGLEFRCHCYGNGIGEWNCKRTTPPEASVQPVQVMISESPTNRHSHPVRWINPSSSAASGYNLKWRAKDSEARWREVDLGVKEDGYVVTGLDPGITYEGQLFTLRPDGHRDVTRFQFSTSATPPPEPPEGLKVVDMTESSITIGWDRTDEQLTAYRVVLLPDTGRAPKEMMLHPGATSVMLLELVSAEAYTVRLYAVSGDAQSRPSSLQASTHGRLTAPRELRVTDVEETALRAEWLPPPGGPISGYRVRCLPAAGGEEDEGAAAGHQEEEELPAGTSSHRLEGLQPGQHYVITVTAVRGQEHGPPASLSVDTLEPFVTPDFKVDVTETTITISWASVPGLVVRVLLVLSEGGADPRELSADTGELLLPDLTPSTEYTLTIIILLHGVQRGPPIVKLVTTSVPPPRGLEVEPHGDTGELRISWIAPEMPEEPGFWVTCVPTEPEPWLSPEQQEEATIVIRRDAPMEVAGGHGGGVEVVVAPGQSKASCSGLQPGVPHRVSVSTVHGRHRSDPVSTVATPVVPPPSGLRFGPVGPDTMRVSWLAPALPQPPSFYRVVSAQVDGWEQPEETRVPGQGSGTETTLTELRPGTEYEVAVHTIVGEHESVALMGTQRTAPDPPRELQIVAVSDSSLNLQWLPPAEAAVSGYRVRCATEEDPSATAIWDGSTDDLDDRREASREEVLPRDQTSLMLEELAPGRNYIISVYAVHGAEQSSALTGRASTLRPLNEDLFKFEMKDTMIVISWPPIQGLKIKVMFAASNGREDPRYVSSDSGLMLLPDLSPHAEYTLTIIILLHGTQRGPPIVKHVTTAAAAYAEEEENDGSGGELQPILYEEFESELADPSDLRFSHVGAESMHVSWAPAPPPASPTHYVVHYSPLYSSAEPREVVVAGDATSVDLGGLHPGLEYRVKVHAADGDKLSAGASGTHKTAIDSPTQLEFLDVTDSSLTVAWQPPRAAITGYRVRYGPEGGAPGYANERLVTGDRTQLELHDLEPGTDYVVRVISVDGREESLPLMGQTRTEGRPRQLAAPRELRVTDVEETALRAEWLPPPGGPISGYRVRCLPAAGGEEDEGAAAGHREEEELPAGTSSHRLEGLQPGQRYVITVTAVRGQEHGPPASLSVDTLAATNFLPEFRIEVNETTINISWDWWPGLEIKVLLVPSEEDGDPRELSSVSGELLLPDLTPDTEYTLTIIILLHGAQRGPPVVKHIATLPLSEREPESLAFPTVPSLYRHITADFIQQVNAQFVISTKKPPTAYATSLNVTFDIEATLSSIVFRWRTVPGLSIKVRLLDKEFTSDSGELLLSDLSPGVEYTLTIVVLLHGVQRGPPAETRVKTHSIHQAALGEDFAKWFNSVPPTFTASMPEVQLKHDPDFKVDTTETSITISWNSFPGLVIKVLLVPSEGSADPLELSSDSGELLLPELSPGVEYTLTIIILLHGVQRGTPIVKRVTTLSPLSLEVAGESPSSLTLTWYQPSAPVDHYTVTCTPLSGREEVRELLVPGSSSRATLQGLATAQEYNVSIRATYGQQQQGGPMLSSQPVYIVHYLGVDQPSDMQILDLTESSIRVRWNPCRAPILGYLLTCTPTTHPAGNDGAVSSIEQQHGVGEPISMDLSRGETDVTITKLVPTVEYVISVCARRHNQDSEPTTLTFTTKVDSPRGLEFLQVAETWVLVQWEPPEGRVSSYRITYESSNEGTREFPHTPRVRVGPSSTLPPDVDRAWPPGSRGPSDEMGVLAALGEHSVVPVSSLKQGEMELGSEVVTAPEGVALILFGGDVEEANITGLTPGLEYTVRVYATYGQDESVPLTGCQVTAIPAPTDLQFHFVTASGLTVSWAAPVGVELTGFRVVLMPRDRKGPTLERSQSPKVTTTTINGLLAQTEYEVSVYALKNYLASKSLQAFQKTQASLYAPGRLRALSVTGSTVLVAWRSRAVRLSAFLLIATPLSNEGLSAERLLSPLLRACTITGLSPGVTYSISIYAMREGSRSQPTSITVTTKFLGAASPTFLRDGRSDHVGAAPGQLHTTVTWRPSGGSTEHHVTCLPIGDSSPVVKLTLPGGAEAATLRGLRPGAVYRVLVEAMGLDGRNTLLDETLSLNNTGTTEGAGEARILDGCLEGTTGTAYAPGEHWEQRAQNGLLLTCTCLGEGRGHVRCDSSKWCYDSRQSYRIGEQWSKRSHAGQKLQCTCLGNLRGEILCEPDESVCYEGGKEFSVGQQWEKVHESSACSCACLGGKEGWQCDCERLRAGQQPWQGPSSARTAQLARQ